MAYVDDIATGKTPAPEAPSPRKMGSYRHFVSERRLTLYRNSQAYVNRRVETRRFPDALLRKVIKGASFVAAYRERYSPGTFNVSNMKYFVIHRPGSHPPACTLLNTLRTFSDFADGRKASTHFVIGYNGEVIQMVDLADTAYHCGTKSGKVFNRNSVGVELEGAVGERLSLQQYTALARIIRMLHDLSGFLGDLNSPTFIQNSKSKIVGHQEILADKRDPGYNFNYALLATFIRDMPPTSKNGIFRPPVDPLQNIESSIQTILSEAQDPGSVGSASMLSITTQDALAMQRATMLALSNRTDMAGSAAVSARCQSAFMGRKLAEISQKIEMLGLTWEDVPEPGAGYGTYIDYEGAIGKYVTEDEPTPTESDTEG